MDLKSESAAIYVLVILKYIDASIMLLLFSYINIDFPIIKNKKREKTDWQSFAPVAIVCFQIVACLYLVMVVVIVGLNYRLRGRHSSEHSVKNEQHQEMEEEMEDEETLMKTASVSFSEAKGGSTVSSLATSGNLKLDYKDNIHHGLRSHKQVVQV